MDGKINLGILFGGRSCEHEVSVISCRSILEAIDLSKYNVTLIGIDKSGHWILGPDVQMITESGSVKQVQPGTPNRPVSLGLHHHGNLVPADPQTTNPDALPAIDVVFPVLHGTFGEDGTVQGVLEMSGLPYVGCGVAASALAMDKALAKSVFASLGIPQAPYCCITAHQWQVGRDTVLDSVEREPGLPAFVKPANLGSSVGVSKAGTREELTDAISHALEFDVRIVVEQAMENCHEVECAVLGNQVPKASILGEIIPGAEFYNYETKYLDDKSQLIIPAPLDEVTTTRVQELSVQAFKGIDGRGLARVDFFVDRKTNEIFLNEINTMPGFTPISMYPRLWAASGLPYEKLIDTLIELGLESQQYKQSLKRSI